MLDIKKLTMEHIEKTQDGKVIDGTTENKTD